MTHFTWGLLCLFSPTYCLITWLKRGKPKADKTALLRWWSRGAAAITVFAVVGVLIAERLGTINPCIVIAMGVFALWRANEIVFAFFRDATSRLGGEPQTTSFTAPERLKFVAVSYLEMIGCFGFVYLGLQTLLISLFGPAAQAYKKTLPSLADAIYLSSTIITTLGYGESDPAAWSSKILSIWEVFSGFVLFAVALSVYLGSEKTVPIAKIVAPASMPSSDAPVVRQ
jgi:hypothetical protein